LRFVDADATQSGLQHFTFIGFAEFSGGPAELRYFEGSLYGNVDDDSTAEFCIELAGAPNLTVDDLVLA
jgi:hypothetical protein